MSPVTRRSLFLAGLLIPISSVNAENIRIVTGLSFGYSNFSFPEKLDHDISFPSTNLALVVTEGRWQLAVNSGVTLEDATISEEEDIGKASRNDLDVTLAYQATRQWAFFTGYKSGETKMRFTGRDSEDEDEGFYLDESYSQKGPFVGGSYSWQFENAGRLSISLAYAFLDATNNFSANTDDNEEDEEEEQEELEFDDLTGTVEGDITGLSYGVTWTMPLSSNLLFQTRLKVNDYQQDIKFEQTYFKDIDENFTTLHVGLAYVF
jgi:hypothetical protein